MHPSPFDACQLGAGELDLGGTGGRTPLHLASIGGHFQCVRMLLQKGAWADAFDAGDNSALHLAAR